MDFLTMSAADFDVSESKACPQHTSCSWVHNGILEVDEADLDE